MKLKSIVNIIVLHIFAFNLQAQVNKNASTGAKKMYEKLTSLPKGSFYFGHQDALAYGVKWKAEKGRSDVKDVTGNHPYVIGWDLAKLENNSPINIDSVSFKLMKDMMKYTHKKGGINTLSWHIDNPVSKGNAWDKTPAVNAILPGGKEHEWYKAQLDKFVNFSNDITVGFFAKKRVPILFRPFHEHTGNWFWWGKGNCTAEEYKNLWKFTYDYLTHTKKMDNLLWAYSTDVFNSKEQFLEFFPGDEYVDLLGFDDYHDVGRAGTIRMNDLTKRIDMLAEIANAKNKPFAITETGFESIPTADWWTQLYNAIQATELSKGMKYVLIWRNANTKHHYAPYPGAVSANDFIQFKNKKDVIFMGE
jgi:mannan endo-1,4-beta-mannosidase